MELPQVFDVMVTNNIIVTPQHYHVTKFSNHVCIKNVLQNVYGTNTTTTTTMLLNHSCYKQYIKHVEHSPITLFNSDSEQIGFLYVTKTLNHEQKLYKKHYLGKK